MSDEFNRIINPFEELMEKISLYRERMLKEAEAMAKMEVEFGSYPFEADGTMRPIRWSVLKREDGKTLLLSAYVLDAKPYNKARAGVTWETCTLRKWLNGEFLDTAFTEEEKRRILLTKLKKEDNPRFKMSGSSDTEDRIFLLSVSEVKKYLLFDLLCMRRPTPYAIKQEVHVWENGNCWWWLRSPGRAPSNTAYVDCHGMYEYVFDVDHGFLGVCPAL